MLFRKTGQLSVLTPSPWGEGRGEGGIIETCAAIIQLRRGKIHIRHFLDRRRHTEEIALRLEPEQIRHEVARKGFAFVAIVADVAVVKPARGLDAVLGVHEFGLELKKIL